MMRKVMQACICLRALGAFLTVAALQGDVAVSVALDTSAVASKPLATKQLGLRHMARTVSRAAGLPRS